MTTINSCSPVINQICYGRPEWSHAPQAKCFLSFNTCQVNACRIIMGWDGSVSKCREGSQRVSTILTQWDASPPSGATDTYCHCLSRSLSTLWSFTLNWAVLSLSPHPFSFPLPRSHSLFTKWPFCHKLPLLSGANITKLKTRHKHKQKAENQDDLIGSVLSCPFWPFSLPSLHAGAHTEWMNRDLCWCLCSEY